MMSHIYQSLSSRCSSLLSLRRW